MLQTEQRVSLRQRISRQQFHMGLLFLKLRMKKIKDRGARR